MSKRNKAMHSESGFTLLGVLMVLVVLSVLGAGVVATTANVMKVSSGEHDDQSAFYIAEAGIALHTAKIEKEINGIEVESREEFNLVLNEIMGVFLTAHPYGEGFFEMHLGQQPKAIVIIKPNLTKEGYTITSKGEIGKKSRTVSQEFKVNWEEPQITINPDTDIPPILPSETSIFMEKSVKLRGVSVKGHLIVNSQDDERITIWQDFKHSDGAIYVPQGSESTEIIVESGNPATVKDRKEKHVLNPITKYSPFPMPEFPQSFPNHQLAKDAGITHKTNPNITRTVIVNGILNFDTNVDHFILSLSSDIALNEWNITRNATMIIDVGDYDKEIVVDRLNITSGHIKILGDGKLTIYVKENLNILNASTINNDGAINKLNIYLKGSIPKKTLEIGANVDVFGSLYAQNANILISRSGSFRGPIFTGGDDVTITGSGSGNPVYIYAPAAEFNVIRGGNVKGTIIGKSLNTEGNVSIEYRKMAMEQLPFFPPLKGENESNLEDENPPVGANIEYINGVIED